MTDGKPMDPSSTGTTSHEDDQSDPGSFDPMTILTEMLRRLMHVEAQVRIFMDRESLVLPYKHAVKWKDINTNFDAIVSYLSKDSSMDSPSPDSDTEQPFSLDNLPWSSLRAFWSWWMLEVPMGEHAWPSCFSLTPRQQQKLAAFIVSLDDKVLSASTLQKDFSNLQEYINPTSSTPTPQETKPSEESLNDASLLADKSIGAHDFEKARKLLSKLKQDSTVLEGGMMHPGNVGRRVDEAMEALGMQPPKNPPRVKTHAEDPWLYTVTKGPWEKARKLLIALAHEHTFEDVLLEQKYVKETAHEIMEALGMQPLRKDVQDEDVPPASRLPRDGPSCEAAHTPRAGSTD